MKFSMIFGLMAGSALAIQQGTPVKRDGASISSAISTISASVAALSTGVANFQTAADAPGLQAQSDAVVAAINAGTAVADASAPLSSQEAFGLASSIGDLANLVNTTVQAVIDKKPIFVGAGQQATILTALQTQLTSSQQFANAVINKLPPGDVQAAGRQLSQPILDSLAAGIAAYQSTGTTTTTTASTSAGQTTSSGTAYTTGTYSGWESWSGYTTKSTTSTKPIYTWEPIKETKTWSNYLVKPTDSWADIKSTVYKTVTATWANVEVTYTIPPKEWETATIRTPYATTWSNAYVTPASSWVEASVKPYASASGPVKVWQGAAPAGAVASFGVVVLGALAGAVAML